MNQQVNALSEFRGSMQWFQNFKNRKKLKSMKSREGLRLLHDKGAEEMQVEISKSFCVWHPENIVNTEEVTVLFRSFPSRTICVVDQRTDYKPVENRLTAALSVIADGNKLPLVIIRKSRRHRSFPETFDATSDLGIFNFYQGNYWSISTLWAANCRARPDSKTTEAHVFPPCR